MLTQVDCKIITTDKTVKGIMYRKKNHTFADMVKWIYKNCSGCTDIKIDPEKEVQVIFNEVNRQRIEIYTLKVLQHEKIRNEAC